MQLPDDTMCSVPQKPSPKSWTSVRRKKVKKKTIEKPSACSGETIKSGLLNWGRGWRIGAKMNR